DMSWTITGDHQAFEAAALPLLLRDPVANTVALSVLNTLRRGHQFGEQPAMLAWLTEQGEVTGAVLRTPPWALLLAVLPPGREPDLVSQLRRPDVEVPSVNGTEDAVRRFSECWTADTGVAGQAGLRQRLFRLDGLVPPEPAPAGSARLASQADLDLAMDWLHAFGHEA